MTEFALLDSLNPVLAVVDRALASLSLAPVLRIAIFAALGSVVSMLLFKKFSNQAALADLKQEIRQVQNELVQSSGKRGELGKTVRQNLKLTGRQLWLSFWPAILASVPILFLLAFCSNQYGAEALEPGARVYVTPVELQGSPSDFEWHGVNAQWDARKKAWTFYQPEAGQTASLFVDGNEQLRLPTVVPIHVLHKKQWWNVLIANPAGYLDDDARIASVEINTPMQIIIGWGPGWMRGWLFAFMLFLVLFSVAIKILWKIH
jgi:hypothetical protein